MRTGPSLSPNPFHCEAEVVGDIIRPALIGRQAMRPIERRVDFDAVKPVRVSHQMAAFIREGILVCLWDRPSGGPNIDAALIHVLRIPGSGVARKAEMPPAASLS